MLTIEVVVVVVMRRVLFEMAMVSFGRLVVRGGIG